jgi:acetyltransferase-like isoleucine patch superfamily enzyme
VVSKDAGPYAIVGGVPARFMKARSPPEQIHEHERIQGLQPAAGQ